MYTLEEINENMENDWKEKREIYNRESIDVLKEECKRILEMQDIDKACQAIKTIRNTYKNTQSLPIWFRKLIFLVIYNYLVSMYEEIEHAKLKGANFKQTKAIRKNYKNQTQLLENMGLVKDIFRKTHWNMYSSDMKAKQKVYISMKLPLKYREVECDDIYRAMIHYMVCYAKVPTDTFVDVYGEFGLSALFCANGYKHEIWVEDKKLLKIWKEIMMSKSSRAIVYKKITEIQNELKDKSWNRQREQISELLQKYWLNNFLNIRKPEEEIDKIAFVTETFIANSLSPEYWLDSNVIIEKKEATEWLDEKRISKERIQNFIEMTKEEFFYFANAYRKMNILEINREDAILLLKNKHNYYKELKEEKEREFLKNYNKLLYIDAPKYIQEYIRKDFNSFKHMDIVEMLKNYDGEWILTWKNNIEKKYAEGSKYSPLNYRHKKRWEYEQEVQARMMVDMLLQEVMVIMMM